MYDLIIFCKSKGFKVVTLNWNVRDVIEEVLKLSSIYDLFNADLMEPYPNKHLMFREYIANSLQRF